MLDIYDDLRIALEQHYPDGDWSQLPPVLQFASWIGGDRDGNPNVTADVTLQTLATLRKAARQVYLTEIAFLRDHLTQSTDEIDVSPELIQRVQGSIIPDRSPDELYRLMMGLIWDKLDRDEYPTHHDLLDDLLDRQRQPEGQSGRIRRRRHAAPPDRESAPVRAAPRPARHPRGRPPAPLDASPNCCTITGRSRTTPSCPEAEKQALLTREITNPRPFFPIEPIFSETTNRDHRHLAHDRAARTGSTAAP